MYSLAGSLVTRSLTDRRLEYTTMLQVAAYIKAWPHAHALDATTVAQRVYMAWWVSIVSGLARQYGAGFAARIKGPCFPNRVVKYRHDDLQQQRLEVLTPGFPVLGVRLINGSVDPHRTRIRAPGFVKKKQEMGDHTTVACFCKKKLRPQKSSE